MSEYPTVHPVNFVEDLVSADDFARKHTPHISVSEVEGRVFVSVQTGYYVEHPNEPGHFFDWIELYVNGVPVARFSGMAAVAEPNLSVVLNVEQGTKITALASCNLHGVWKAEAVAAGSTRND